MVTKTVIKPALYTLIGVVLVLAIIGGKSLISNHLLKPDIKGLESEAVTPTPTVTIIPTNTPTPKPKVIYKATPTPLPTSTPTIKPTPTIDTNRACIDEDRHLAQIKEECGNTPFPGIDECVAFRSEVIEVECKDSNYIKASGMTEVECKESNLARVNKMKELKPLYLQAKAKCGQ